MKARFHYPAFVRAERLPRHCLGRLPRLLPGKLPAARGTRRPATLRARLITPCLTWV